LGFVQATTQRLAREYTRSTKRSLAYTPTIKHGSLIMATITHKRGDTFVLSATLENSGNPVDITNFTITSQVRDVADELLQALTVTVTDANAGAFTVSATPAQTETWDVKTYVCDIEFVEVGGEVNSTETFEINVLKDITRD
jgi:hypothetical protein